MYSAVSPKGARIVGSAPLCSSMSTIATRGADGFIQVNKMFKKQRKEKRWGQKAPNHTNEPSMSFRRMTAMCSGVKPRVLLQFTLLDPPITASVSQW